MKFNRCCLSLLLSLCLALSVPFSSLADLATDSQATYVNDIESVQRLSIDIAPMSSISTIQNTVDYSDVAIELAYYDMSNVVKYAYANVSSDGSFNMSRPSDIVSVIRFGVIVNKRSLPSSGTFSFVADFAMHTPMTYGSSFVYLTRVNTNATSESTLSYDMGLVQNYGDFQVSGVLRLGLVNSVAIMATVVSSVPTTISGVVKIKFTRSSSTPDVSSPGADSVDQDIQSNISNNTGTLVEQQEETNGLLVQIISTISNQLTAFWNQLAGEFTNLFNKMNQQHQEAMEAVEDQTSRIEDSVQGQTQKIQDKLEDVKTGIISGIINGLKSLFIPSDEFFKTYFDDLFSWFSDRLGFLSFPIDLLAQLVEMFLGSSSTDFVVTLPSFEIMGEPLLQETSFNLTQFLNENFGFLLTAIHLGVSVIMVFGFIKLCERKWEEVMMN